MSSHEILKSKDVEDTVILVKDEDIVVPVKDEDTVVLVEDENIGCEKKEVEIIIEEVVSNIDSSVSVPLDDTVKLELSVVNKLPATLAASIDDAKKTQVRTFTRSQIAIGLEKLEKEPPMFNYQLRDTYPNGNNLFSLHNFRYSNITCKYPIIPLAYIADSNQCPVSYLMLVQDPNGLVVIEHFHFLTNKHIVFGTQLANSGSQFPNSMQLEFRPISIECVAALKDYKDSDNSKMFKHFSDCSILEVPNYDISTSMHTVFKKRDDDRYATSLNIDWVAKIASPDATITHFFRKLKAYSLQLTLHAFVTNTALPDELCLSVELTKLFAHFESFVDECDEKDELFKQILTACGVEGIKTQDLFNEFTNSISPNRVSNQLKHRNAGALAMGISQNSESYTCKICSMSFYNICSHALSNVHLDLVSRLLSSDENFNCLLCDQPFIINKGCRSPSHDKELLKYGFSVPNRVEITKDSDAIQSSQSNSNSNKSSILKSNLSDKTTNQAADRNYSDVLANKQRKVNFAPNDAPVKGLSIVDIQRETAEAEATSNVLSSNRSVHSVLSNPNSQNYVKLSRSFGDFILTPVQLKNETVNSITFVDDYLHRLLFKLKKVNRMPNIFVKIDKASSEIQMYNVDDNLVLVTNEITSTNALHWFFGLVFNDVSDSYFRVMRVMLENFDTSRHEQRFLNLFGLNNSAIWKASTTNKMYLEYAVKNSETLQLTVPVKNIVERHELDEVISQQCYKYFSNVKTLNTHALETFKTHLYQHSFHKALALFNIRVKFSEGLEKIRLFYLQQTKKPKNVQQSLTGATSKQPVKTGKNDNIFSLLDDQE